MHCGCSCYNKNFQIRPISALYRLADDANGNHNCIACLFFLQAAHSDSSFHYLNCFLERKLKNSKKSSFCIESKVEFSGKLKSKATETDT